MGAGDPDVDGAFIFDLRRGALRFVDEAARREQLGFVPFRRDAPESERENLSASDALGPSASVGTLAVGDDTEPLGDASENPATPAAFLARAHEFRAACAFAELDPPPPPPPSGEDVSGGEAGGGSDAEAASETEKASSETEKTDAAAPAEAEPPAPPDSETVAAEPSSATTATLATTVAEDPALDPEPAVAAPLVPPRVFVAYPDQDEYFEVLSSDAFAAYRAERLADATCAAAAAPVSGPEAASGAVSHTFLTPLRPAPAPPAPTHVPVPSPRRPVAAAEGPRAVPSLRVPSAPAFPAAPATLVVPRIAATDEMFGTKDRHRRDSTDVSSRSDKTFVFRQIIEYPAMSDAAVAALDRAVHAEADASLEHARVAPESYLLRDVRSDAFLVAEQNLADRVVAARRSKEAAYAARRAEELAAEAEEARRLAEEALDSGIYALAREAKVAPRAGPAPPRGPKPAFPPVSFFDVEEGREALRAIVTETDSFATRERVADETVRDEIPLYSDRRTLPPRRAAGSLPPSVRLAAPEPPPPRAFSSDDEETRGSFVDEDRERRENGDHRGGIGDDLQMESSHHSGLHSDRSSSSMAAFSGDRTFRTATRADFTGKPRSNLAAPASYYREKAPFERNTKYEAVEGNARRRLRTASTTLAETRRLERVRNDTDNVSGFRAKSSGVSRVLPDAQFELSPAHVHFGRVAPGVAVKRRATLTNVSSDLGRFSVRQPSGSAFSIEHTPGMVSPGLAAQLKVVCRASRPGEYVGEATILTESQVFVLSLSAVVMGPGDAENILP